MDEPRTTPQRPRSPYILFATHQRDVIKATLAPDAGMAEVMRALATTWKNISEEDKRPWLRAAEEDKQRYEEEMAVSNRLID